MTLLNIPSRDGSLSISLVTRRLPGFAVNGCFQGGWVFV